MWIEFNFVLKSAIFQRDKILMSSKPDWLYTSQSFCGVVTTDVSFALSE